MNTVALIGRLTRDPELRYAPSGTAVVNFSIAVDRAGDRKDDGTYESGFFDVTAWGNQAENVAQYLTKGRQVGVEGRLQHHRWEKDGEKKSKVQITASYVTFVGSRSDNEDSGGQRSFPTGGEDEGGGTPPSQPTESADFGADDDIPF